MGGVLDTVGKVADTVGGGLNTATGGLAGQVTQGAKDVWHEAGNYIAPAAAALIAPSYGISSALAAAAAGGAQNYSQNHDLTGALGAAGGSYVGSNIGSMLPTPSIGSSLGMTTANAVGPAYNSAIGGTFGGQAGAAAGNALGSSLGSIGGSYLGGQAGSQYFAHRKSPQGPAPFQPSMAAKSSLPGSLSGMSSLTPMQQATGLATQGVYGGGNGPEEQSYFMNLVNRQLMDNPGSHGAAPISSLPSIETSYLNQLGLGGYDNSNSLLKALTTWSPS